MQTEKSILKLGDDIIIPADVAVCPICGAKLRAEIDETQESDSGWKASSIALDCEREPDIGSDGWEEFFTNHYSQPYIDWHPLHGPIVKWINENYTFRE